MSNIKFYGKVTEIPFNPCSKFYGAYALNVYPVNKAKLCPGRAHQLMDRNNSQYSYDKQDKECMGWGYTGTGPHLLSVAILACTYLSSHPPLNYEGYGEPYCAWFYDSGLGNPDFVHRHYKQFTADYTSKWGDKWEITLDEVREWVKKQEQPKETNESNTNNNKDRQEPAVA